VAEIADPKVRALLDNGGPIGDVQTAALTHEDPWARRGCLDYLDHHAADESTAVFLAALEDPVAPVREIALHGLACERCRTDEICIADVVPEVIRVLESDPSADVRYKTLEILRNLGSRQPIALHALERAAESDADPLVRRGARIALGFGLIPSRNDLKRRVGRRLAGDEKKRDPN
jgi:HEAT repeat protein